MVEIRNTAPVKPLFEGWEETPIWSCLQGTMGTIYADDAEHPSCGMAIVGDLWFLAGKASPQLAGFRPKGAESAFSILVPQNEAWGRLIEEHYGERAKKTERYAMKKSSEGFNRVALQNATAALPEGYSLRPIEEELFALCRQTDWCRDFVSNFPDYDTYHRHGLGVAACWNGQVVAGASSYTYYHGGIEIEIDTLPEHRRRGLAHACAAALILKCLDCGLYPSWDAANKWSVALAEKLGYYFDHPYPVYWIEAC